MKIEKIPLKFNGKTDEKFRQKIYEIGQKIDSVSINFYRLKIIDLMCAQFSMSMNSIIFDGIDYTTSIKSIIRLFLMKSIIL